MGEIGVRWRGLDLTVMFLAGAAVTFLLTYALSPPGPGPLFAPPTPAPVVPQQKEADPS